MKKFLIPIAALFLACISSAKQPSWQQAPSTEEGVDVYYWDAPTTIIDNPNQKRTRMLFHGSDYGPSLIFDITFDCSNQMQQLNQISAYSEEFAEGVLVGEMMNRPDKWESLEYSGEDFWYIYKAICN